MVETPEKGSLSKEVAGFYPDYPVESSHTLTAIKVNITVELQFEQSKELGSGTSWVGLN